MVVELFNISVLDLTSGTIRLQLQQLELQTRGVRAADALHVASAIAFVDLARESSPGPATLTFWFQRMMHCCSWTESL
jgi:hypothetical protein